MTGAESGGCRPGRFGIDNAAARYPEEGPDGRSEKEGEPVAERSSFFTFSLGSRINKLGLFIVAKTLIQFSKLPLPLISAILILSEIPLILKSLRYILSSVVPSGITFMAESLLFISSTVSKASGERS